MRRPPALSPLTTLIFSLPRQRTGSRIACESQHPALSAPLFSSSFPLPSSVSRHVVEDLSFPAAAKTASGRGAVVTTPTDPTSMPSSSCGWRRRVIEEPGEYPQVIASTSSTSSSSPSPQKIPTEMGMDTVAVPLLHLLQLHLRCEGHPATVRNPTPSPMAFARTEDALHQLLLEIQDLEDKLRMYRLLQPPRLLAPPPSAVEASRSRGVSSQRPREAPHLTLSRTDAEETWLLPLQRDVMRIVMYRLHLITISYRRLLEDSALSLTFTAATRLLRRVSVVTGSRESQGAMQEHLAPVYEGCTRVVAELLALRDPHEHDAGSLACLVHLLTAAAKAGVTISVVTAVEAVQDVLCERRGEGKTVLTRGAARNTPDATAAGASTAVREAGMWRSCVPWLLYCYVVTHTTVGLHLREAPRDSAQMWSTASAWMTAAADCMCAAPSANLLHLSPSSTSSMTPRSRRQTREGNADVAEADEDARAHTFGPWQRVLDADAAEAPRRGSDDHGDSTMREVTRELVDVSWLRQWYAVYSPRSAAGEGESGAEVDAKGTLCLYWQLVVLGMVHSGADAVDVLLRIKRARLGHRLGDPDASWSASEPFLAPLPSQERGRAGAVSPPTSKCLTSQRRSLVAAVQYHAVGTFVSLRRITGSLQRHRRLAPLFHLHRLVSGYEDESGNSTEPQPFSLTSERKGNHRETLLHEDALTMPTTHSTLRWRQRLLSGELLELPPAEVLPPTEHTRGRRAASSLSLLSPPPPQRQRRSGHDQQSDGVAAPPSGQLHQAGALLWREVALFDAYVLILIGHVSEHAVDGGEVNREVLLRHLSWLQEQCAQHLRVLEAAAEEASGAPGGACCEESDAVLPRAALTAPDPSSHTISPQSRRVLLCCLTPRTRATLISKLREGLRLSAKVLVRWREPRHICALYLRHPSMGASWEVGRALLQCGHYGAAVTVLRALLQSGPALRGLASSVASPSLGGTSVMTSGVAVRQLLLEAMEGAAAALLHCHDRDLAIPSAALRSSVDDAKSVSSSQRIEATTAAADDGDDDEVAEAPLPSELRVRLQSFCTHLESLPVAPPLCLDAVMRGLSSAHLSTVPTAGGRRRKGSYRNSPCAGCWESEASIPTDASLDPASVLPQPPLMEERRRMTAVLCTSMLRRYLLKHAGEGLLSRTVELWASNVAAYWGRTGSSTALSTSEGKAGGGGLRLSVADQYIRAVTVRLMFGYPQLPVARLLLSRLLQMTAPLPPTIDAPLEAQRDDSTSEAEPPISLRATAHVLWVLEMLYGVAAAHGRNVPYSSEKCAAATLSGATDTTRKALAAELFGSRAAYRLHLPTAVVTPETLAELEAVADIPDGCPCFWNAGWTERYVGDILQLMPRIALEGLVRVLRSLERIPTPLSSDCRDGAAGDDEGDVFSTATMCARFACQLRERLVLILAGRAVADVAQRQPWQCCACHLWNSRFSNACKRCGALSTVLLQCRMCGYLTSSVNYEEGRELHCEVCASMLLPLPHVGVSQGEKQSNPEEAPSAPLEAAVDDADSSTLEELRRNVMRGGAATVTGTGRPASCFTEASAAITRVVSLRPWTCTHCHTPNEAHHVFFCRRCGWATTDAEKWRAALEPFGDAGRAGDGNGRGGGGAAVSVANATVVCGCCGLEPKSLEARLLPWCERCGALHQRLQQVLSPRTTKTTIAPPGAGPLPSLEPTHVRGTNVKVTTETMVPTHRRSAFLWLCVECTTMLNPWTRTHCSLCGAGRPAAAGGASSGEAGVLVQLSSPPLWRSSSWTNSTAPFITISWAMQTCSSCAAQSVIGRLSCWKCGAALSWPLEVRRAVSVGWRLWVTQVVHVVVDQAGSRDEQSPLPQTPDAHGSSAGTRRAEVEKVDERVGAARRGPAPSRGSATDGEAPLLIPIAKRWLCLRNGCLHINNTDGAAAAADSRQVWRCIACSGVPRYGPRLFDPFVDHFGWRSALPTPHEQHTAETAWSTSVTDAVLLPSPSPRPGEVMTWLPSPRASHRSTAVLQPEVGASKVLWQRHRGLPTSLAAVASTRTCALCGEAMSCCPSGSPGRIKCLSSSSATPTSIATSSPLQRLRPLLWVEVCAYCGGCSWGRSCCAYDAIPSVEWSADSPTAAPQRGREDRACGLLPGELAMSLRLLLKALACAVTEAASSQVAPAATTPSLDWAWLSRFVYSAIQLMASSVAAGPSTSTEGVQSDPAHLHSSRLAYELLPWRGSDLASERQTCSATPWEVVLERDTPSDDVDDDSVHPAMADVRLVLDGICTLVEHRTVGTVKQTGVASPVLGLRRSGVSLSVTAAVAATSASSHRTRGCLRRGTHTASSLLPPPYSASGSPLHLTTAPLPRCLQDAWTRRLLLAALDLVDLVNASTTSDEIGFTTLRRLCCLVRPHDAEHIRMETKWAYLLNMKLSRSHLLNGCVECERCLTNHPSDQGCA